MQSPKRNHSNSMKSFRLVPLVLAGLCGYIHTVINRRFDEIGDLMHRGATDPQPHTSLLADVPSTSLSLSRMDAAATASSALHAALEESRSLSSVKRVLDMELLQGPAVDEVDRGHGDFRWKPPAKGTTFQANSAEYQEALLQFTINMLPRHLDSTGGSTTNKLLDDGTDSNKKEEDSDEDDLLNPKPYDFNQVDIIVPASGQDERLRLFADHLGIALSSFVNWYETERRPAVLRTLKQEEENQEAAIEAGKKVDTETNFHPDLDLTFRFIVTRYPADAQKTDEDIQAFQKELSERAKLPLENIGLIRVGHDAKEHPLKFNRAHARNVLHQNACHSETCIVTAMDVDMQVLPIFFHRALRSVKPYVKGYFPIVFSEFNPDTVQLVQDFLYPNNLLSKPRNGDDTNGSGPAEEPRRMLEPFSRHRGLWRDFGYGMYVLAGSDAERFRFNEEYQGWGHEDNDFYKLVHNSMRVDRQREHGLIHGWHPKNCDPGKDIITQEQWLDCLRSRNVMEGGTLGLLLMPALPEPSKANFPGLPKTVAPVADGGGNAEKKTTDITKDKKEMNKDANPVDNNGDAKDSQGEVDGNVEKDTDGGGNAEKKTTDITKDKKETNEDANSIDKSDEAKDTHGEVDDNVEKDTSAKTAGEAAASNRNANDPVALSNREGGENINHKRTTEVSKDTKGRNDDQPILNQGDSKADPEKSLQNGAKQLQESSERRLAKQSHHSAIKRRKNQ